MRVFALLMPSLFELSRVICDERTFYEFCVSKRIQPKVEGGVACRESAQSVIESKSENFWTSHLENSLVFLLNNVMICMFAPNSDQNS